MTGALARYRRTFLGGGEEDARINRYLIAGSLVIAALLLAGGGSLFPSVAFIGCSAVLILTFYRIEWGFYTFVAAVLFFDQFIPPEFFGSSTSLGTEYFQNLKSLPALANVSFAVFTPMELHLLLIILAWLTLIAFNKKVMLNPVPIAPAAILFFLWLGASFVNGMRRGGDFLPALWELRALFYLGIMFVFVPQVIQTKQHLRALMWITIGAAAFKAAQGLARFASVGFTMEGYSVFTNHEDPLFWISLFIFFLGLTLFGARTAQKGAIRWLLLPFIAGFIVAQRRAAFGALVISVVVFLVMLPREQQFRFLKMFVPVAAVFCVYLAVFWTSEDGSAIAAPAVFIRSSFYTTEKEAAESYSSNLYREMENYDLAYTSRRTPLIGIGFGNKYDQPLTLPNIAFPLRDYIPHNEIFWLIVKMGSIGFFFFCLFMTSFVFRAAAVFARLKDPYLKALCIVSIAGVLAQIVVSYFDLQLTFYRNMIYLGMLMGVLPTLELADEEPAGAPARPSPVQPVP
jgi:hypothetical protein